MLIRGPLTTPVLFLVFNRPEPTRQVFDEIRKARPTQLFVAADGPRENRAGEVQLCQATRDIVRQVDWDCELHTNFHEENLGLKIGVSSSIEWFFEHVDAGIILEDDCLPSQSFFWYCQELLDRYAGDTRIMQISGNNFLFGRKVTDASYYFSKLNDIWGWATWKRAWKLFDIKMESYPLFVEQDQLRNYLDDPEMQAWLMSYLEEAYAVAGSGGLWSSQWTYAMCVHNGLTVVPSLNLVENIGLSGAATHLADSYALYSCAGRGELLTIRHPPFILPNRQADAIRFEIIRKTDPRLLHALRIQASRWARKHLSPRSHSAVKALVSRIRRRASASQ